MGKENCIAQNWLLHEQMSWGLVESWRESIGEGDMRQAARRAG